MTAAAATPGVAGVSSSSVVTRRFALAARFRLSWRCSRPPKVDRLAPSLSPSSPSATGAAGRTVRRGRSRPEPGASGGGRPSAPTGRELSGAALLGRQVVSLLLLFMLPDVLGKRVGARLARSDRIQGKLDIGLLRSRFLGFWFSHRPLAHGHGSQMDCPAWAVPSVSSLSASSQSVSYREAFCPTPWLPAVAPSAAVPKEAWDAQEAEARLPTAFRPPRVRPVRRAPRVPRGRPGLVARRKFRGGRGFQRRRRRDGDWWFDGGRRHRLLNLLLCERPFRSRREDGNFAWQGSARSDVVFATNTSDAALRIGLCGTAGAGGRFSLPVHHPCMPSDA